MATRADIIEHFQWLVDDDTIDSDQEIRLCNRAYLELCAKEYWNFLKTTDSSTITGSTVTLPSDFLYTNRVILRRSASSNDIVYAKPVAYEDRLHYIGDQTKYYIDQKNGNIVFTQDPTESYSGWLALHDYQYLPAALSTDSDVPVWNAAFHYMLSYEMAKQYYYNDQGEKNRSWNREMEAEYARQMDGLRSLDSMVMNHYDAVARVPHYAPGLE